MSTQAENVLLKLRELIMEGQFPPGSHLMEIPVAEQLQVSRTPVRWALGALAQEGLLDYKPKRGFMVRGFSSKEIVDAVEARGAVEALACSLLAARGLSEATTALLERNLKTTDALARLSEVSSAEIDQWCVLNKQFHSTIAEECGNAMVCRFVAQVETVPFASPRTLAATTSNLDRMPFVIQRSYLMHQMIYEAIRDRNPRRAEALMREHVSQGADALKAALESVAKVNPAPVQRAARRGNS